MSWRGKRRYLRSDSEKKNQGSGNKTIVEMFYESLEQEAALTSQLPLYKKEERPEMKPEAQTEKQTEEQIKGQAEKQAETEILTSPAAGTETGAQNRTGLEALEPADVFSWFRRIAAIPHGSFHTKELSDSLESFAGERGLACIRDGMGNLIISRPGSAGFEEAPPIALQGHIDMVCEKDSASDIDMEKEPVRLCTDGEWLWADGTTLGGDDGIAAAMMLALLADDSLCCPPLECIFTVDEEVGLLGANAIDLSSLRSRRLINIDSESEGILTAGCAGGAEEICSLPGRRREKRGEVMRITVSGLRGGHSGEAGSLKRANADILLARLLYRLQKTGKYCIVSMNGGNRDNAVPREARAEILFTGKVKRKKIRSAIDDFREDVRNEYADLDPDIRIETEWTGKNRPDRKEELRIAFTRKDSSRMVRFLLALPNGLIEYEPDFPEIPRTSLSLGIVKTMADGIRTHSLVRSSIASRKQYVMDRIECIGAQFGAVVETNGSYPGWQYRRDSAFRGLAVDTYRKLTGSEPLVCVTHGGLECGLLADRVPGLDCISIGPDMEGVHTPEERLNIPSTARTYAYLRALLEAAAAESLRGK